jgi:LacI family repressor for deo operon, udp, cdd, tsx, nupC, and nupG
MRPRSGNTSGATLRDVAEHAGVSISTASRALTGSRPVSEALTDRVQEAAITLGYRANVGARNLRLSRTMTIGLIYEQMDTPVYLDFLEGMIATADRYGYSIIVSHAAGDTERYGELVRRSYEQRVDALLLSTPRGIRADLEPFLTAGVPTLALFGRGEDCADIPVATVPQTRAIGQAAKRLSELGHRRALYLSSATSLADRWRAVELALGRAGVEPVRAIVPDGLAAEDLRQHLVQLLAGEPDVTAMLAHGRHLGGLFGAIHQLGERIPEDRSLVTFTDSRLTIGLIEPPLSSIHVDTIEFGERAIEILEAWLGGKQPRNVIPLDLARWQETQSVAVAPRA